MTDLNREKELILKGFDSDARYTVRKAKRFGASLKQGFSTELLDRLYELLAETGKRRESLGYGSFSFMYLPFLQRRGIEQLLCQKHAILFYVEDQEGILSMQLVFNYMNRAYVLLMGSTQKGYRHGAPTFNYYEVAARLKDLGVRYCNIGGVPSGSRNAGLGKFKRSLGTEIIETAEESTNFLLFPLCLLNPLMNLMRILPDNKVARILKRILRKVIVIVLGDKELLL